MTYEGWVGEAVKVVETFGGTLMVVGAGVVLVRFAAGFLRGRPVSYADLRVGLGRVIQVGLEILILGDVLRTVVETPTIAETVSLTMIVIVRLLLSFGLQVELGEGSGDGMWPRGAAGERRVPPGRGGGTPRTNSRAPAPESPSSSEDRHR